jgi:hypothetical protein
MGYTTVGQFMSLQRAAALMPFYLLGHACRRHHIFFPWCGRARGPHAPLTHRSVYLGTLIGGGLTCWLISFIELCCRYAKTPGL